MRNYQVENFFETYGKGIHVVRANTPFDAAEKATSRLPWRHKDDLKNQRVTILDGSKNVWTFEK